MRTLTVIAVVAVLIVATFGAGYLAGNGNRGTRTITSTSTLIITSTTTVSTSSTTSPLFPGAAATAVDSNKSTGLDLVLALNSTTLKIGQKLQVDISLFNALPSAISMAASQDWPFRGVPVALWPACYSTGLIFDTPAYAVLFKGNHTLQGVQSAANTTITFMCMEAAGVDHVVFEPDSSQAYLTGSGFGPDPGPYQLSLNFTTNGYWDLLNNSNQVNPPVIGQQSPTPPIATPFVPGVYTIAVSDEWGQVAVLHFTVTS
jgi:hypothetical protein